MRCRSRRAPHRARRPASPPVTGAGQARCRSVVARAPRDVVRHDAVDADRAEHEREPREQRQQRHNVPRRSDRPLEDRLIVVVSWIASCTPSRPIGIARRQQRAPAPRNPFSGRTIPDDRTPRHVRTACSARARRIRQIRFGGIADDADDALAAVVEREQHAADGILAGKNFAASASLMTTTRSLPSRSEESNWRPRRMGRPSVVK